MQTHKILVFVTAVLAAPAIEPSIHKSQPQINIDHTEIHSLPLVKTSPNDIHVKIDVFEHSPPEYTSAYCNHGYNADPGMYHSQLYIFSICFPIKSLIRL